MLKYGTQQLVKQIQEFFFKKRNYRFYILSKSNDTPLFIKENKALQLAANPYKNQKKYYENLINYFPETKHFSFGSLKNYSKKKREIQFHDLSDSFWQFSIALTGYAYNQCIFTNKILRTKISFITIKDEITVFIYKFNNGCEDYYLISNTIYCLEYGIFYPKRKLLIQYYDILPELNLSHIINEQLQSEIAERKNEKKPFKGVCLIYGSGINMGHSVWSELSGLEFFLTKFSFKNLVNYIYIGEYDYFNILNVFPVMKKIKNKNFTKNEQLEKLLNSKNILACQIIGSKHTKSLRRKIHKMAGSEKILPGVKTIKTQAQQSKDVFWFNIRNNKRIWSNQVTEIPKIINQILKSHRKSIFIIDGITKTKKTSTSLNKEIEIQEALVERIKEASFDKEKVFSVVGFSVSSKIQISSYVTFFISPYGSSDTFCARLNDASGIYHTVPEFAYQLKMEYKYGMYENVRKRYLIEPCEKMFSGHPTHYNYTINADKIYQCIVDPNPENLLTS